MLFNIWVLLLFFVINFKILLFDCEMTIDIPKKHERYKDKSQNKDYFKSSFFNGYIVILRL